MKRFIKWAVNLIKGDRPSLQVEKPAEDPKPTVLVIDTPPSAGSALAEAVSRFQKMDQKGKQAEKEKAEELHPLNDPIEWALEPAYLAPAEVDVERCQKEINSIYGTTRGGEPILKLAWSGDRTLWHEVFMQWNALGKPTAEPVRRPRLRYKTIRDEHGRFVRDVFPPRWLILSRLEPEQYAETYRRESYFFDPELRCDKQIRPDEPPKVYWLWFATVASHNGHCCATARKNRELCYGKYAPPGEVYETIGRQKIADEKQKLHSPFEKVSGNLLTQIENRHNNYFYEVAKLKAEAEIYIENPLALIGTQAAYAKDLSPKQAREIVKDYYEKQISQAAEKAEKMARDGQ